MSYKYNEENCPVPEIKANGCGENCPYYFDCLVYEFDFLVHEGQL